MGVAQIRMDEFVFVLLAAIIFLLMLVMLWGIPEGPPAVEPTFIRRVMRNGTTETFSLTIWGNTSLSNVKLTATGPIAGWLSFSKTDFDVSLGARETVVVEVRVPVDAVGMYKGEIRISSRGGNATALVEIHVINVTEKAMERRIYIGEVKASYLKEDETLDAKQNFEVVKGYLVDVPSYLVGIIEEEKFPIVTDAWITLMVEDTNALGSLAIFFNDQHVYEEVTFPGEVVIPLDIEMLQRSNRVAIRAGLPGWMFWTTTWYKLEAANFTVRYEGSIPYHFNFTLEEREWAGFEEGRLTFLLDEWGKANLVIKINDYPLYRGVPPFKRFTTTFGREVPLRPGVNTISFEVEPVGTYKLSDVLLFLSYYALS